METTRRAALLLPLLATPALAQRPAGRFEEVARFPSPAAFQGVGVDAAHAYTVADRAIIKHDKRTGAEVARWEGPRDGPIIHLDAAAVIEGRLYAAHSNYPEDPMTSSVEVFDPATMQPVESHSFGIQIGALNWVDRHEGAWWAVFANYSRVFGRNQRPYGNTYWTQLIRFDDAWRQTGGWVFPPEVLRRADPMSISGGSWGPDGMLWCTGHDHPEVYSLRLPRLGSVLERVATYPIAGEGQGIAWDRSDPGVLWQVSRARREVIAQRFVAG